MKKYILFLVIATASQCFAQDEAKFRKIDSLITHLTENNKFMGSVSIMEKDKVVFEKAYGYADLKNETLATPETKYKIGSITKMFTSVMIFQLIEKRKLNLDTKLSEFFPEIKNSKNITIKNLLNHTSGIYNYTNDEAFMLYIGKEQSQDAMVKRIAAYEPEFETGSTADYSNSNYLLLGYIIENITGKKYNIALKEMITDKLGFLNSISYYNTINASDNEAHSYFFSDNEWKEMYEWDASVAGAAGAIQSTTTDLTRFIRALFEGQIIKKSSLDEMMRTEYGYGKGIFAFPFGDRNFYGHNGSIESFDSMLGYYQKDAVSFSMIANGSNDYSTDLIQIGVLSIYYKLPYQFPNFTSVTVDAKILKGYTGVYAAPNVPLKIEITYTNGKLMAQATGQNAFPLTATSENEFNFQPAGIIITFNNNSSFIIKQGGTTHTFTKE